MKPLLWITLGGAAVGAGLILLFREEPQPAPSPQPTPKTYGEATKVALAVPSGWRRVTSKEVAALPELRTQASALRNTPGFASMPYGTLAPFVAGGATYATWIEQHYHAPGSAAKPWGLHHGVTLLAQDGGTISNEWRGS